MDFSLLPIVAAARETDADGTQRAALSHAQLRQWFLWELDPGASAYHIAGALRLRGALDAQALRGCFDALVARHEALRTVFGTDAAGQVFQRIAPAAPCSFECIAAEQGDGEAEALDAARRLAATPFDLRRGPLLRAGLIRLAADHHVLVVVMHHIVSDGWSKQVLVDELLALYRARVGGGQDADAALPELPVRYADYAAWQRHWLEAGEGARQLEYWTRQLGGAGPALQLPADHARRADGRYQAAAFHAELPPPLVQALQRRAQAGGTTLFTLLLAGFQVLLHRHSGESDIRVGVPVANRHRAEVERVVGFFVNMQVLRNRIDGRMPLAQVLAQAREAALGAQAHQDLPFEQLVDALRPERSLSVNPLFQVAFNHERIDGRAFAALPGLQAEGYALPDPAAQFELVLNTAEDEAGRVQASFIYAAELFTPKPWSAWQATTRPSCRRWRRPPISPWAKCPCWARPKKRAWHPGPSIPSRNPRSSPSTARSPASPKAPPRCSSRTRPGPMASSTARPAASPTTCAARAWGLTRWWASACSARPNSSWASSPSSRPAAPTCRWTPTSPASAWPAWPRAAAWA